MISLYSLSPLDGRYANQTLNLKAYFSESALIKYRVRVECAYFISLIDYVQPEQTYNYFTHNYIHDNQKDKILNLWKNMSDVDIQKVKDIEKETNHDVKAVEYYLKDYFMALDLKDYSEWIHLGLTSEDINNLAYSLMLKDTLNDVIFPAIKEVLIKIREYTEQYSHIPMLSRTHGQPASPTTLGKEFAVYLNRLMDEYVILKNINITGKLNGAVGNYNALRVGFENHCCNWLKFSEYFISGKYIKLEPNLVTTQIESHDSFARIFDSLARINNIILDLNTDIWYYISLGYFKLDKKENEVGSSTMPHKINPIDFENSEGNLGFANSQLHFLKDKLTKSRLQRDLSDSTVLRNIGAVLGYCLLGYKSNLIGLNKLKSDNERIINDLNSRPEILAEAIQTVLRVEGIERPYELLKDLTRGSKLTIGDLKIWIQGLEVNDAIKKRLLDLTPETYTGQTTSVIIYTIDKFIDLEKEELI